MASKILMLEDESSLILTVGDQLAADDNLVIDLKRGCIMYKGNEQNLSAQEIKLMDYFYRHANTIISREELLNSVWGYDSNITTRIKIFLTFSIPPSILISSRVDSLIVFILSPP